MTKISVKQFIRGKLSTADRPNYDIVARSRDINDSEIQDIIQEFNGSQPLATKIPNYQGAWLISPINNNQVALLRQERSSEIEFGRQYFLYEHYLVFKNKDVSNIRKPWLFTLHPYKQQVFSSPTFLKDHIEIDDAYFLRIISTTLAELFTATTEELNLLTLQHLYTLLDKQKIKIGGTSSNIQRVSAALCLMLPSSYLNNLKVYFGNDLPYSWNYDVAFLNNTGWEAANYFDLEKILSNKVNESYTKIILKILSSNKNDWQDFPNLLDDLDLDVSKRKTEPERILGNAIFKKIGLRLIKVDIKLKRANSDDIHIAWKELSEQANARDIEIILPAILEGERSWDEKDYSALGESLPKHSELVFQCLSNIHKHKTEKFTHFIDSWLEKQPTQHELDFIAKTLFNLRFQNFSIVLKTLLQKEPLDFKALYLLLNNKNLVNKEALILFNIILNKAKKKREVTENLSALINNTQNRFLKQLISFAVVAAKGINTIELQNHFSKAQNTLIEFQTDEINELHKNLLSFAINLRLENVLTFLLFEHQKSYEFISLSELDTIRNLESWAQSNSSILILVAYAIVLFETNHSQEAKNFLTRIFLENTYLYNSIFDAIKKTPNPKRYTSISLERIDELKPEDAAKALISHLLITKSISSEQKAYFITILKKIPYSSSVADQLEGVHELLVSNNVDLRKVILELQIKDAILEKNIGTFDEKINILEKSISPSKSVLRNRIVLDYLKALSNSPEKYDFINSILFEPISSPSIPKVVKKAFATSLIFRDNFKDFFEDINCRIIIYRWIHQELINS